MTRITSFSDVIDAFGTAEKLAAAIGERGGTVRQWRARNSIPSEYWPRVADAAKQAGIDGITVDALLALARPRKRPASPRPLGAGGGDDSRPETEAKDAAA
jgi:hypothetical protein